MRKPNLFIIGASKCGSTFLHHVLEKHPDICMSTVKEPWFFSSDDYKQKMDWYLSLFENCKDEKYVGESSPIYSETTYFPDIPKRIYQFSPDAKLIYLVREPFSRLESVYKQTMSSGHWAEKKFYHMLMPREYPDAVFGYPPFLEATKYWTHIQNYLKYFSDDQIKVVLFEELAANFDQTIAEIFEFLQIRNDVQLDVSAAKKNESSSKRIYNPMVKNISYITPSFIKYLFPSSFKKYVIDWLKSRSKPVPQKVSLSAENMSKVRATLEPEVKALYDYMGVGTAQHSVSPPDRLLKSYHNPSASSSLPSKRIAS